MQAFEYCVPTRIVFGKDSVEKLPEQLKKSGASRVLAVYGGHSAKKSGLLDRVLALLGGAGVSYDTLGGVQPNPHLGLAREGVKKAIAMDAQLILAIGGGSVIDTAKAIAHGKANPDIDIWDFWLGKKKVEKTTPVGVILTIPASGSETSDSAVLTDETILQKRGLNTDYNRPVFAIMDPTLAATLPRRQVACGVTDILMHTLERYFNPIQGNETTMQLAESVLRVAIANGPAVVDNPGDYDAMSEIMWCGSLSHNGLTGLGGAKGLSVHPVSFALSEKFDIIHAEALSALWCRTRSSLPALPAASGILQSPISTRRQTPASTPPRRISRASACRFPSARFPAACRMRRASRILPHESATMARAGSERWSVWTTRRCAKFSKWRTTEENSL